MAAASPLSAARLYHDAAGPAAGQGSRRLRDGAGVFAWTGDLGDAEELAVTDDTGCVHFSYWLRGGASYRLEGGRQRSGEVLAGAGIVGHAPDSRAWFRRRGPYVNVVVLMPPEALLALPEGLDPGLRREVGAGFCYRDGYRGGALRDAALALFGGLRGEAGLPVHPLWLQAKSLEFVALFLEDRPAADAAIPAAERRRLLAARDRLLADLADPPTIPELARACGLNVLKLKRGFRQLFGTGVYGLFQRERMHEARRRLLLDDVPVGRVAADLGYANASHFAVAFRKQFGIAPKEIGRGR